MKLTISKRKTNSKCALYPKNRTWRANCFPVSSDYKLFNQYFTGKGYYYIIMKQSHLMIIGENVQTAEAILRESGFSEIIVIKSVSAAIDTLRIEKRDEIVNNVDIFLIDDELTGMSGVDACLRLKVIPQLKHIPIILLTNDKHEEKLKEAFDAGVSDFIVRPFCKTELNARVISILKLKKEQDKCLTREKELSSITNKLSDINKILTNLSNIDVPTGLSNRNRFDEYLEHEWKFAVRESESISLLLVDIDYLQIYYEKLGKEKGDKCLMLIVQELKTTLKRPGDLLARFNGDTFGIILAHTDAKGAETIAELLRLSVSALKIEHPRSILSNYVSITIGYASAKPSRGNSELSLIVAAEQALYTAKKDGRNCSRQKNVIL
ncbi:MAG: diguanylate cyclase [Fibrobacteres bacterium]|nr:diguanylate cyclase [Fibrobacterota bacterium]